MDLHLDPWMVPIVAIALAVVALAFLVNRLRLPTVVAYLLAGVLLGPQGIGVVSDTEALTRLGGIGVVLLLFFAGMEISLPHLLSNWKLTFLGTQLQILISLGCVWGIGYALGWPLALILLVGFVISLSSTAVVLKLLQDWNETNTRVGQDATGILLVQDLAIIPMLIVIGLLGGQSASASELGLQIGGGIVVIVLMTLLVRKGELRLPFAALRKDHEMQVFSAFIVCFGFALLTGLLGLSTALGAFLAGIVVTAARETHWVHDSIASFRVILVAVFFISIGMLVDLRFLAANAGVIGLLVLVTLITNTLINSGVLKLFGRSWRRSFYGGALLSQIGEFSFVLAAVGLESRIIDLAGYQMAISVIAATLFLSPLWILLIRKIAHNPPPERPRIEPDPTQSP